MTAFLVTAVGSYLLGSIPFGYLLVRMFRRQDIRETGSGNIGATNVSRTSPALGVLTLLLDAAKGLAAVTLTRSLFPRQTALLALAAFLAIIGHMFPVWLNFRGGKGVATGLGAFAVIVPKTILAMIGLFIALFLVFRYVSLASILTAALFPLLAWALQPHPTSPEMLMAIAASSFLIVVKHHENLRRLFAGTEPRFQRRRE
ncbi:MAG: glycerol-3-phosphate 1-O-acyltransferase PlsY [Terriglobales bacterium]